MQPKASLLLRASSHENNPQCSVRGHSNALDAFGQRSIEVGSTQADRVVRMLFKVNFHSESPRYSRRPVGLSQPATAAA